MVGVAFPGLPPAGTAPVMGQRSRVGGGRRGTMSPVGSRTEPVACRGRRHGGSGWRRGGRHNCRLSSRGNLGSLDRLGRLRWRGRCGSLRTGRRRNWLANRGRLSPLAGGPIGLSGLFPLPFGVFRDHLADGFDQLRLVEPGYALQPDPLADVSQLRQRFLP